MPERTSCSVDDCPRPSDTRGWCRTHYMQWRRTGSPVTTPEILAARVLARFESSYKVDEHGCWLWTAGLNSAGYGRFQAGGPRTRAHRWSYEHFVGPIPDGLDLDHMCHNNDPHCPGGLCRHRACVNPKHVEPATRQENVLRGKSTAAIHAAKTHCPQGHPLSGDNLYRTPKGERICRICKNKHWQNNKLRRLAGIPPVHRIKPKRPTPIVKPRLNDGPCSIDGCDTPAHCRGWCGVHYNKWRRFGDPTHQWAPVPAETRFWRSVKKTDSCWLWTATLDKDGYGHIYADGQLWVVHRYAYELLVGPIPKGLVLDHLCHRPDGSCSGGRCIHRGCVNPAHLTPTTLAENVMRGVGPCAEHARKTHCIHGHPLSGDNIYVWNGVRVCKICRREVRRRAAS